MEGMDNLINAMSNEKLEALKGEYADQPSVATLIDGILGTRAKVEEQARAKAEFVKTIDKLTAKLPHPDDVHNVFMRWSEVDVEEGEPVEIAFTSEGASKPALELTEEEQAKVDHTEMRTPTHKEYQWVVEVNHATKVGGGTTTTPKGNKLAVQCWRREGTTLIDAGRFKSKNAACVALGYGDEVGVGSAGIPLAQHSIIVEPYEGTDFTS